MPHVAQVRTPRLIPALPEGLAAVPPGPSGPEDPDGPARRAAWLAWRNGVLAHRAQVRRDCADGSPIRDLARAVERQNCAEDPAYFVAVWCTINETRGGAGKLDVGWHAFVPMPVQVDAVRWYQERRASDGDLADGLDSKSRDFGATDLFTRLVLHGWLFEDNFIAKLISRNEAAVDSVSYDSLFARITSQLGFIKNRAGSTDPLPAWLLPPGFDQRRHSREMSLVRPDNANEINGEATTTKAGRGGRCTVALVDEAAFIEHFAHVWATLAATARHRIAVSSESLEVSPDFYRMVEARQTGGDPTLFTMDWWQHPLRDHAWLESERERYAKGNNLNAFAREVLRDAAAGLSAWAYPMSHQMRTGYFPYIPGAPRWDSIDPGFDDECALHIVSRNPDTGRYRLIDTYIDSHQPPEKYASIIAGLVDERHGTPDLPWVYTRRDLEYIEFVATLPRPRFVYGDPAGFQRHGGERDDWYSRMDAWWAAHNINIVVWAKPFDNKRAFQTRRSALQNLLPNLDFHDSNGAAETLRSLKEARFDQNDRRATEQKALRHDEHSHPVSGLEFFAYNHTYVEPIEGFSYKPLKAKDRRTGGTRPNRAARRRPSTRPLPAWGT